MTKGIGFGSLLAGLFTFQMSSVLIAQNFKSVCDRSPVVRKAIEVGLFSQLPCEKITHSHLRFDLSVWVSDAPLLPYDFQGVHGEVVINVQYSKPSILVPNLFSDSDSFRLSISSPVDLEIKKGAFHGVHANTVHVLTTEGSHSILGTQAFEGMVAQFVKIQAPYGVGFQMEEAPFGNMEVDELKLQHVFPGETLPRGAFRGSRFGKLYLYNPFTHIEAGAFDDAKISVVYFGLSYMKPGLKEKLRAEYPKMVFLFPR